MSVGRVASDVQAQMQLQQHEQESHASVEVMLCGCVPDTLETLALVLCCKHIVTSQHLHVGDSQYVCCMACML